MSTQLRDERRVAEEAAAWIERLKTGDPAQRVAFSAWAKESPRHVRDFLLMTALDAELVGIDQERKHDLSMADESDNVVSLDSAEHHPNTAKRPRQTWRIAAGLAAAGIITTLVWSFSAKQYTTTAVGEQRTVELEDGSVLYLNARSRVETRFTADARELRLVEGEALFKVQREPGRPFRVRTADAVIQAVGTQFNVRCTPEGTRVAVIEGKVKVLPKSGGDGATASPLSAGEAASVASNGRIVKFAEADVEKTLAWRQRRLVFRTDTLADIATEFNRYNRAPKIVVEGADLAARQFSGVFDADDPEALAQVLSGQWRLAIDRTGSQIVIRAQN